MKRCRPTPKNRRLYAKVTAEAKRRFRRWPSAYASGWVVQTYRRRGGEYADCGRARGGLTKWFRERWVDVCYDELPTCGRPSAGQTERDYRVAFPKCRPLSKALEMTPAQRKRACRRKRRAVRAQPLRSKVVWVR